MSMRFLGIAGSVCAKSTSKGLLRAAAANLPARVEMAIADQMRAPGHQGASRALAYRRSPPALP